MGEISKKEKLLKQLEAFGHMRCPVCKAGLAVQAESLVCKSSHTFDINKKGFVNLALKQSDTYYDEALFAARANVFQKGYYAPVLEAIREKLENAECVLDAGCGEGYYLKKLNLPIGVGVDLSREAIMRAARENAGPIWCVADLANLPFEDSAFDAVLDILSPANYSAFARVLKRGGRLIKISPGKEYLVEIRRAMGLNDYDDSRVTEHMREAMGVFETRSITRVYDIADEDWQDFVAMTPLTKRLPEAQKEAIMVKNPGRITVDLILSMTQVP